MAVESNLRVDDEFAIHVADGPIPTTVQYVGGIALLDRLLGIVHIAHHIPRGALLSKERMDLELAGLRVDRLCRRSQANRRCNRKGAGLRFEFLRRPTRIACRQQGCEHQSDQPNEELQHAGISSNQFNGCALESGTEP